MKFKLRSVCAMLMIFSSLETYAQGTSALEIKCGKYLKAAPKDKALLDGVIIGFFQGYNQGVVVGSNDERRALTLRGASSKDMFQFVQAYCSNHPEAMIQGPLLTYIVAADGNSLDVLQQIK